MLRCKGAVGTAGAQKPCKSHHVPTVSCVGPPWLLGETQRVRWPHKGQGGCEEGTVAVQGAQWPCTIRVPCHAAVPCHAVPHRAVLYHAMLCHAVPCCPRRVDQPCPRGWWGHPTCGPCSCDVAKGFDPDCNKTTGECRCKVSTHAPCLAPRPPACCGPTEPPCAPPSPGEPLPAGGQRRLPAVRLLPHRLPVPPLRRHQRAVPLQGRRHRAPLRPLRQPLRRGDGQRLRRWVLAAGCHRPQRRPALMPGPFGFCSQLRQLSPCH